MPQLILAAEKPLVIIKDKALPDELAYRIGRFDPHSQVGRLINSALAYMPIDDALMLAERLVSSVVLESSLYLVKIDGLTGRREDLGKVSEKVITTAGVNRLVSQWVANAGMGDLKYHGIGTGTNAEATGDTALQTELTTEYNPDSTRATGSLATGASSNILKTIGTNTLDSGTPAVTECGLLNQAATGGGTLWDRFKFAAINLVGANADGLQSTITAQFSAGG